MSDVGSDHRGGPRPEGMRIPQIGKGKTVHDVRIHFKVLFPKHERPELEQLTYTDRRAKLRYWFWDEVLTRDSGQSSETIEFPSPVPEESGEYRLRTSFVKRLQERLQQFTRDAGAGASASIVECHIEQIDYGSLDLVLRILGVDIIAQALGGSLDIFVAALGHYAVESFELTFPGTHAEINAVATASPSVMAVFRNARTDNATSAIIAPTGVSREQLSAQLRRQWLNSNVALVVPSALAFLVLMAFGFYLLHTTYTSVVSEREDVKKLLATAMTESRAAKADAEERARAAEAALGRILESLVSRMDAANSKDAATPDESE